MDRELAGEYLRRKKIIKIVKFTLPLVILILLFWGFKGILTPSISRSRIRTGVAENGDIEATLTASGKVIPKYEQSITSPFLSKIDSIYHRAGDLVKAGDQILKIDTGLFRLQYEKLLNEYELTRNQQDKLRLNMERDLIELNTQLEIMNLKVRSFENRLEAQKIIFESGGGPRANYDQAKLDLNISQLEAEQLQQRISNKEKSFLTELKELELRLKIQQNSIEEMEKQLQVARTESARDGVVTWVLDEIGATVFPGDVIAKVADLTDFRIEAITAEVNAPKILIGNQVKIRLNEQILKGNISNISPAVENGTMTFLVDLNDQKTGSLRPNIRVDVDVITSALTDIIRIPNSSYLNGSGIQDIFVIRGNKAFRRTVKIGRTSFDYAEVLSGLEPGEEIILNDLSEYIHRPFLKIKK